MRNKVDRNVRRVKITAAKRQKDEKKKGVRKVNNLTSLG